MDLTDPERQLVEAAATGDLLDLRCGDPAEDDPAGAAHWPDSRTIRAEVLADLLTTEPSSGRRRPVRLAGAHITGELGLEAATVHYPLRFDGCAFTALVDLTEADTLSLELTGCHLTALHARHMRTRGSLDLVDVVCREEIVLIGAHVGGNLLLSGATVTGSIVADSLIVDHDMFCRDGFTAKREIRLLGARIGGQLNFDGAHLANAGGHALLAGRVTVGHDLFFRDGFSAKGELHLAAAHVGGHIDLEDARLTNPGGVSLAADQLAAEQGLFCEELTSTGEIRLVGARIGGTLNFDAARLINPGKTALTADNLTVENNMFCRRGFTTDGHLRLLGARLGGLSLIDAELSTCDGLDLQDLQAASVWLTWRNPPAGTVELTAARVGYLEDDPSTWPERLMLRDFSYEVLGNLAVRDRLDWLTRHEGGFEPGLYDQLAAVYRRSGRVEDAREVSITKQKRRRAVLGRPGRAWNWLLRLTVGYGYKPWLAGLWLIALSVLGTLLFTLRHPADFVATRAQAPDFQPLAYTLDVLLPIVDLGQQSSWLPQRVALACAWLLIIAGWVLATTVIAGVTNALRRD